MKLIFKKTLIILLIICILLPSLFSGFVLAADGLNYLNRERAGNFAANFAINFYENWSSISVVGGNGSSSVGGSNNLSTDKDFIFPVIDKNVYESDPFKSNRNHQGYDISSRGREGVVDIYSVCAGEVIRAGWSDTMGYCVIVSTTISGYEFWIRYMHMYAQPSVKVGDLVEPGTYFGKIGNTGDSSGAHLHIDFSVATKNDAEKLKDSLGEYIYNDKTNRYFFDPLNFIPSAKQFLEGESEKTGNIGLSTSTTTTTSTIRGEIQTQYDPLATLDDIVEGEKPYTFSNSSWIEFVYKYALNISDQSIAGLLENDKYFDNETQIFENELVKNGDIIDISTLVTEGKVLPGDILYAIDGQGSGEYLLYVGGTKIIYATPSTRTQTEPVEEGKEQQLESALRYEYLQYYLERKKNDLIEIYQNAEDSEDAVDNQNSVNNQTTTNNQTSENNEKVQDTEKVQNNKKQENIDTEYGVIKIYRIKQDVANAIKETDATLIFAGKSFYTDTKYEGIPEKQTTINATEDASTKVFKWIFDSIIGIFEFILNTILYTIRMQVVGWANMVELLIQSVVLGISGDADIQMVSNFFGPNATSASGTRITVESIFFNQIPIIDANFFNFETAGGHSLKTTIKYQPSTASGHEAYEIEVDDTNNIVYQLRYNLRFWYVILRNASIALLLFVLIYLGIRLAIASTGEKKADAKKLLVAWLTAFIAIVFIHYYMYIILDLNDTLVGVFREIGQQTANEIVQNNTTQELNLYDAIRVKAYSFSFVEGVPATVLYIYFIYLLIRFLFIYVKRFFTIYILALSGSLISVKYAFERIGGKKTKSLSNWMIEFAFNVLLQTVHALIYVLYMSIAIKLSQSNIAGFFICLIVLNFMLNADRIFMKIFGLDKAGSISEVDKPESFLQLVKKFAPMIFLYKKAFNASQKYLFGKRGIISEIRYSLAGFDNYRDAEKEFEKRKYDNIGKWQERFDKLYDKIANSDKLQWARDYGISVRKMAEKIGIGKYASQLRLLKEDYSLATKKEIYNSIKRVKAFDMKKYTRPLGFTRDLALGLGGMVASTALLIADPAAGVTLFQTSKRRIDKNRTMSRAKRKNHVYKVPKDKAKMDALQAQSKYYTLLDTYTNNQFEYEEKKRELLDKISNETDATQKQLYQIELDDLDETRKAALAVELHELQEAYEDKVEKEILYKNALAENNKFMKVAAAVTGANILGDMFQNQVTGMFEDTEAAAKEQKRLAAIVNFSKDEEELRGLMKDLKENWEETGTNVEDTIKVSNKSVVRSSTIKSAITRYMYENKLKHVSDENIDGVIALIEEMLEESGSQIVLSNEFKQNVAKKLKENMIAENKGLGFDKKDTTTFLSSVLGEQDSVELTVSQSVMQKAITDYMVDNGVQTITEDSVENIVKRMQKILNKQKSTIKISNDVKMHIKDEIVHKISEEGAVDGLDIMDTIETLSSVFREDRVVEHNYNRTLTQSQVEILKANNVKPGTPEYEQYLAGFGFEADKIRYERQRCQIMQKIREMHTKNEVARVKFGGSLVSMTKVLKEAKKL